MTADQWCERALAGEPVWNIGQLGKPTIAALDRLVRQGKLRRTRAYWCQLREKTVWCLPDQSP